MKAAYPCGGFTLLELLVATTITLMIAAIMVTVAATTLGSWRRSQATHAQVAAARQIFQQLEQDLAAAVHRGDSTTWLAVDILDAAPALANHGWLWTAGKGKPAQGGSLRLLPARATSGTEDFAEARFGLSGCWLRFVAANVEAGGTLPVTVAYQLARRPVTGNPVTANPAPIRYSLYRSAVGNAETLRLGYDVTASAYASADNNPYGALSSAYRNGRNVMNPSHANLMASNVVDFGVWLYVREPDGSLRRVFPASSVNLSHHARGNSTASDSRYPDVVDVLVRILSEEGAATLAAMEAGHLAPRPPPFATDGEWWWATVEAHSRVFIHRIEIKSRAP